MNLTDVYERLCWYDERNPNYCLIDDEFRRFPRTVECSCDNCFSGRDKLAVALLDERKALELACLEIVAVGEMGIGWERQYIEYFRKQAKGG